MAGEDKRLCVALAVEGSATPSGGTGPGRRRGSVPPGRCYRRRTPGRPGRCPGSRRPAGSPRHRSEASFSAATARSWCAAVARTACQVLTDAPAIRKTAITAAVVRIPRCRRANFRSRYPIVGGRDLHRLVGQVALRRPGQRRWPSRTGGRGPSPAPSSRSSPARPAPAPSAASARCPGSRPGPAARPPSLSRALGFGGSCSRISRSTSSSPAASELLPRERRGRRSAARTAARPASTRPCGCPRPAGRSWPARGSCTPACRPATRAR